MPHSAHRVPMTTTLPHARPHCTFGQMSRNATALVVTSASLTLHSYKRVKSEFQSQKLPSLQIKCWQLSAHVKNQTRLSTKGFLNTTCKVWHSKSTGWHFIEHTASCNESYLSWVLSVSCAHVTVFITNGASNSNQGWIVANNISVSLSCCPLS